MLLEGQEGIYERGIDAETGRTAMKVDPRYSRPTDIDGLLGDAKKTRDVLGCRPKVSFKELVSRMVVANLREAEKELLYKNAGFR